MKTLDRYVAREMAVPFIAGFSVVLILLVGNIVYNSMAMIVSRLHQWPQVLYYILLKTPYFVMLALPAGALFGCSLAVSRLARDSEMTMMRMAGVSVKRILLPVFVVGALICCVAYIFQEKILVWAEQESTRVYQQLWSTPGPLPVEAKVVFWADNYCFYVNTVQHRGNKLILSKVLIYEPPTTVNGFPALTTADYATEEGRVWVLHKGTMFRMTESGDPELTGKFETMRLDLRHTLANYINQSQKTTEAMSIGELRRQMDALKKSGLNNDRYKLEYGYKLAIPLSSLVLMLCVGPLCLRFGRSGGFMGVLIGIVVLFFYWNVILFSRVLGETGGLCPAIAGWSEVIIFSAIGAFLLWKVE